MVMIPFPGLELRESAENSVLHPKLGVKEIHAAENWGDRGGVAEKSSARTENNQKFLHKNFHGRTTILRHLTDGGGPGCVSGTVSVGDFGSYF